MKRLIFSLYIMTYAIIANAMSFDEILRTIASNNPSLAASVAEGNAQILSMKSENNLPDPEIGFEHKWGGGGTKWGIGVSQSFEWPEVYSSRKRAVDNATNAMEYLNKANYLEKMVEIKLILVDIVGVRKQLALFQKIDSQMDSLETKYKQGRNRGEVTLLDINKIKIERIALSREIKSLNIQLQNLESSLLKENGGKDVTIILAALHNYPDEIILPEDEYVRLVKENDPQIAQYTFMAKTQEYSAKAIEQGKFPGFSIGYNLENELGTYFNGFSIGLTLPVFSRKYKSEAINAGQKALKLQCDAFEIDRITQIKSQRTNAVSLFQELQQYKPILEDNNNIGLLKKALDGGEINLITYIQEVNFFLEAQKNYLDVEYRYYLELASLNRYSLLKE